MWNNNKATWQDDDDDDSWQVRAFEEDTRDNVLGCTWPPRSYTCSFCRREFRSAQALGGHMNVHRRDRARLHGAPPPSPTATRPLLGREFVPNGLCLLYPLPNPNSILFPSTTTSTLVVATNKPNETAANSVVSTSACHSCNLEPSASNSNDQNTKDLAVDEELDLELRLGPRLPPPS